MIMEKEDILFARNVTILDTLQGIAEHLITIIMNKGGMYLYVKYAINLGRQQDSTKWIEET